MAPVKEEVTEHVKKKPRINCDSFDNMVVIIVGKDSIAFNMHRGMLCNVAPYFKAAFDGRFNEAKSKVLVLSEDDPEVFKRFQLWVYTDKVLEKGEAYGDISWTTLIELYVFGSIRGITDLQNAVVDILIDKSKSDNEVPTGDLQYIYNNTPEGSPLRRLLIDWTVFKGVLTSESWFSEDLRCVYPADFLFDVASAQYVMICSKKPRVKDFKASRQDYYVVQSDAPSGKATHGSG
ncbi:hypothetical protein P7C71_g1920, partial [Lecanoromycetidae sp. Uapishka_2]